MLIGTDSTDRVRPRAASRRLLRASAIVLAAFLLVPVIFVMYVGIWPAPVTVGRYQFLGPRCSARYLTVSSSSSVARLGARAVGISWPQSPGTVMISRGGPRPRGSSLVMAFSGHPIWEGFGFTILGP